MPFARPMLLGLVLALCAGSLGGASFTAPALAGEALVTARGTFSVPVVSLREARFQTVIRQQYDFSCGAAAVATLLTYHYDRPIDEAPVFQSMYAAGDQQAIQRSGFSLFDMKAFLASLGLRADGFQMSLDQLAKLRVPAIALVDTQGYRHFVVIKGIRGDEVLVGDPVLGTRIYDRAEFETMWEGIVFAIRDKVSVARKYFNAERDWAVRQKAPFGTALRRDGLASATLHLPGINQF